jgi:hypothetical protein
MREVYTSGISWAIALNPAAFPLAPAHLIVENNGKAYVTNWEPTVRSDEEGPARFVHTLSHEQCLSSCV